MPTVVTQVAAEFTGKIAPGRPRWHGAQRPLPADVRRRPRRGDVGRRADHRRRVRSCTSCCSWCSRSGAGEQRSTSICPRPGVLLVGLAAVVVVAAIGFAIPAVRAIVFTKVLPIVRRAFVGIGRVLRRPSKVALLFGGSTAVTLAYIGCLYFAGQAFDMRASASWRSAAIYLAASAVATVAPTPGRARRARGGADRRARRRAA